MGLNLQKVRISGGPSLSTIWNQIKADVYGGPLQKLNVQFPENQGDAILAGIATKQLSITDAEKWINFETTFSLNINNHATYKRLLKIYRELYQQTKQLMTSIDQIHQ